MFRGSSFHSIDAKGRIIIPTRFREVINGADKTGSDKIGSEKTGSEKIGPDNGKSDNGAVMVSKMDRCLVVYTLKEWQNIEYRILSVAEKTEYMRRFRRIFIGGACECTADKQGRILIPPPLRHYAGFEKDIVLVGVLDHFEIWSRINWDQENEQMEDDMKKEEVRLEISQLVL